MLNQWDLIKRWVNENGYITPARMSGVVWLGQMFKCDVGRRCRELMQDGIFVRMSDDQNPKLKKYVYAENKKPIEIEIKIEEEKPVNQIVSVREQMSMQL